MESTLEEEKRAQRTKGEQCLDIIKNMSPNQLGAFGLLWFTSEPDQLAMFQRKLAYTERI